jgi:hypothetical protein
VDSLIADVSEGETICVADTDCIVDFETVYDLSTNIDNCVVKVSTCTSANACIHTDVTTLPNKFLPAYSNNSNFSLCVNDLVCNYVPSSVICNHSVVL